MLIDVESKVRITESLDQILWDDFSYLYYLNRSELVPDRSALEVENPVSIEFDN